MDCTCSKKWLKSIAYKMLVNRPLEKRSLGRPSRRREDNNKINIRDTGCEGVR